MAEKSLNMKGKMMDSNIIDYYIINCAIPSIIENRYQIDFGKPVCVVLTICAFLGDLADVVDEVDLKACSRPVDTSIV